MIGKFLTLIAFFLVVLAFLLVGGYATGLSMTGFSKAFLKAFWGESTWIIPPSWALLYGLVALSGFIVWNQCIPQDRVLPMFCFLAVLTANSTWWWLFFKFASPNFAIINLGILWGLTLLTLIVFYLESKWAAALLVPYFAWVSYVLSLNILLLKY